MTTFTRPAISTMFVVVELDKYWIHTISIEQITAFRIATRSPDTFGSDFIIVGTQQLEHHICTVVSTRVLDCSHPNR